MARNVQPGTPNRSLRYIFPHGPMRGLGMAIIGGGLIAVVIVASYVVGLKRVSSPGPVAAAHSPIEGRCEACHDVGRGVADLRCERCHDPAGSDRFAHQGHVLLGSGNSQKAAAAPTMRCAACHTDHQGRAADVSRVDDRDCGQCHQWSSLRRHPEFAAVRAQISTGGGLSFGHERHILETAKIGKKCEACHEPTADLAGFQPMTFERHCAACHTKDGFVTGDSEPLSAELLTTSAALAGAPPPGMTAADRGRVTLSRMKHRDPWVLYNAQRLRRVIDPDGMRAEAAALRAQIAYLTQQTTTRPLSQIAVADLERWQATLEAELASIDTRLASKAPAGGDDAALNEIREMVGQVATQLAIVDPDAAGLDTAVRQAQASPAQSGDPAQLFAARRAELLAVLDAIAARGDKTLTDRAAALRGQVESLQMNASGQPDVPALGDRLRKLDDVLGAVRATADPEAQYVAAQVGALRHVAQSQINGGLSPDAFDDRRRELLGVLDAIERRANPELTGRVAVLRQRVAALRSGSYGDAGLRAERARTANVLGRVKLELELARDGHASPAAAASARDTASMQALLPRARAHLAALQAGGRPGSADTPSELRQATNTLTNMLAPCLKCHVMDGARLAPVSVVPVVFERAVFTHKPHVQQVDCASCHKSVETSTKATDVNEPGVASCRACHQPSKARSACATCHTYHPPSLARLLGPL